MADVCCPVRVGTARDFVVELLGRLGEEFPVTRFRDENVDVLVLEGCAACEQVLVPQSEDAGPEVFWDAKADAETPHPEGAERRK